MKKKVYPKKNKEKESKKKENKTKQEEHYKKQYRQLLLHRLSDQLSFLVTRPFFLPFHIILILIVSIFSTKSYPLIYNYLKFYFKIFFSFAGVMRLFIFSPPKKISKPSIIFTTRSSEMLTPFISTLFPYQLALPYKPALYKLPVYVWFPIIKFGQFIKAFGYIDKDLPESISEVRASLNNNIPTVVYINDQHSNPSYKHELRLFGEVLEILDTNIECYFLACIGFERYNISTMKYKRPISIFCLKSEELFDGIIKNKYEAAQKLHRIKNFFKYNDIKVI